MSRFFLILFTFFSSHLVSQTHFIIEGQMKNAKQGDKLYYYYHSSPDKIIADSILITDDNFIINGKISNPTRIIFSSQVAEQTEKQYYTLSFGSGKTSVTIDFSDLGLSQSKDNVYQEEYLSYTAFRKKYKQNFLNTLKHEDLEKMGYHFPQGNNPTADLEYKTEIGGLFIDNLYAKNNPTSFVALHNLFFNLGRSAGRKNYSTIQKSFNGMAASLQKSALGNFIKNRIESIENSSIGGTALNFEGVTVSGQQFQLADYIGEKVILLDFWASWCAPCKFLHPFFRQLYSKYQAYGLEIIGISRDLNQTHWRNAVEKEKMTWLNTIVQAENKDTLEKYMIQAIPLTILIDKKGRIVGRWTGFDESYYNQIEEAIKQNINDSHTQASPHTSDPVPRY